MANQNITFYAPVLAKQTDLVDYKSYRFNGEPLEICFYVFRVI